MHFAILHFDIRIHSKGSDCMHVHEKAVKSWWPCGQYVYILSVREVFVEHFYRNDVIEYKYIFYVQVFIEPAVFSTWLLYGYYKVQNGVQT